MKEILNDVNIIGNTFDMNMNANKNSSIVVSIECKLRHLILKMDGSLIQPTEKHTYLSQTVDSFGKCVDTTLTIIEMAICVFIIRPTQKTITARNTRI